MADYGVTSHFSISVAMLPRPNLRRPLNARVPLGGLPAAVAGGLTLPVTRHEIGSLGPGALAAAIGAVARR